MATRILHFKNLLASGASSHLPEVRVKNPPTPRSTTPPGVGTSLLVQLHDSLNDLISKLPYLCAFEGERSLARSPVSSSCSAARHRVLQIARRIRGQEAGLPARGWRMPFLVRRIHGIGVHQTDHDGILVEGNLHDMHDNELRLKHAGRCESQASYTCIVYILPLGSCGDLYAYIRVLVVNMDVEL